MSDMVVTHQGSSFGGQSPPRQGGGKKLGRPKQCTPTTECTRFHNLLRPSPNQSQPFGEESGCQPRELVRLKLPQGHGARLWFRSNEKANDRAPSRNKRGHRLESAHCYSRR